MSGSVVHVVTMAHECIEAHTILAYLCIIVGHCCAFVAFDFCKKQKSEWCGVVLCGNLLEEQTVSEYGSNFCTLSTQNSTEKSEPEV